MNDTNQVPHPRPTIVIRYCTKFSRPAHLVRSIYVPLVSSMRVGQVCDIISTSLVCSVLYTKQVCGKLIVQ